VPAGSPMFDSIVVFENYPADSSAATAEGLVIDDIRADEIGSYPLNLIAYAGPELNQVIRYDPRLLDESTVTRLGGHFVALLDGLAAGADRTLADVEMLTAEERHRIIDEFNDTEAAYPAHLCVHEVFAEQARATPDAVAVACAGRELTYAELDRRANQLAHHLRELHVGHGVLVGLCAERGIDLIVGMLGILKAGGAYVPLDPDYPAARLDFMLTDIAAPVIVTLDRYADRLPTSGARIVRLDADSATVAARPVSPPDTDVTPDDLVYVMYTSGSTGTPRGAMVTHRGVVRLVKPGDYCPIGSDDVVAQSASISFDASTFEIWTGLLSGATLAVYPPGVVSMQRLRGFLAEHGITLLTLATGMFHEIVDSNVTALVGLRQIVVGGDVLSPGHCARLAEHDPAVRVINVYGPTECTSITTVHRVGEAPTADDRLPIGAPIANTRVYVLGENHEVLPIGAPGEIYISGDGVGRGYLNRPDLDATRFLPDPFRTGGVLYRSGDRARWRPDGQLEFLGRLDTQVKIRGHRVEPAEVEAVLLRHPDVVDAAVVARARSNGQRWLVGYLVPAEGRQPDLVEAREFLAALLPEHLVPGALHVMDQLPLTPNGKLDRRALPEPDGIVRTEPSVAPRTPTEEALVTIWADALGVSEIGVKDDFFESGGDSIISIRVVARVREAFGIDLSPRELFDRPTIDRLAEHVEDLVLAELERQLSPGGPSSNSVD
ncbi:non-ribosomal peptide synthetase, partial [Micromonospora siamensis]